jgi:hypothetical protein
MTDMDVDEPEQWPLVSKVFLVHDHDTETVQGVHIIDHNEHFSANLLRFFMQIVLYTVSPEYSVPVALMHYLPAQQRIELSLSDTGSEEACLQLRNRAETDGLPHFLRRFKQAATSATTATTSRCTYVEVRYKTLADITTGNVVAIFDGAATLPDEISCPSYHDFFRVASQQ